jgi:hypothetical protein
MLTTGKRTGLIVLIGLGAWGLASSQASAQIVTPGIRIRNLGMNLNQAAFNQGLTGQIFPGLSPVTSFPYANPFFNPGANPLINPAINPFINPSINPTINPYLNPTQFSPLLSNYYNPQLANPFNPNNAFYTNPYLNAAANGFANPYVAYNSATLSTNPYTSGTLNSNGYGTSNMGGDYGGGGYGGYGYPYYSETPVAGFLRGTADMITAQGKWLKDFQQASLIKEQDRQAKIDTRKKIFDQWLYEKQNTPTPEEERQKDIAQQLNRSINNPPMAEVLSGQALNNILADLSKMDEKKIARGQQIPLDEDLLRHVNLTSGNTGNPGLLKNEGRVTWPLALRTEEFKSDRELLDNLAPDAIHQALSGKVDTGVLQNMNNALADIDQKLSANIQNVTMNQYTEATRFLNYFKDAVRLLAKPNAGDFFSRNYAARGMTVGDLVKFMVSKGLSFAPAVTGDDNAYVALHHAMVAYDLSAKNQITSDQPR